jgi:hypothetical protein
MPKAAMDEYCFSERWKDYVGLSRQIITMQPVSNVTHRAQQPPHRDLWRSVFALD